MVKEYFKKNLSGIVLGFVLLLVSAPCQSQQATFIPGSIPNLPTGTVFAEMCQDNNGFIWLASNSNGLYKYDGTELTSFTADESNPNTIVSNRLECITTGISGNIWIGSFENGLDRFNPETETFTHYRHDKADDSTICSDSIRAIIESRDGIIWIGTTKGLDNFDPSTGIFTHIEDTSEAGFALKQNQVRTLYEDKNGTIWIGCGSPFPADYEDYGNYVNSVPGGLYKLDRNTGKITQYMHIEGDESSLTDNRVRAIFEDSRGVFWVGTAGDGLHIMDRENGTFQRLRYDANNPYNPGRPPLRDIFDYVVDHITFINEDFQGCIWIGTFAGGINRYDPATGTVEYFGTAAVGPNNINHNDFWACLKTKDNLLWVTTTWQPNTDNLSFYKISTISGKLNYSQTDVPILDFAVDSKDNMWFATPRGLLRKNKNYQFDNFLPEKDPASRANIVTDIKIDANDNLWLSTRGGLYYFDTKTQIFKAYLHNSNNSKSISSDTVFVTHINIDGNIWVGTIFSLDLLDPETGNFKHFKINPSFSISNFNSIYSINNDESGNIWFGGVNGLYYLDTNTGQFVETLKVAYIYVNNIFKDSRNKIWLGADRGLWVKSPETNDFIQFQDSVGIIPSNLGIVEITEDAEHLLWLITRNGLIRLNPETKNVVIFGKSWDINPQILTGSIYTSLQGEIFFGDTAGYFHFFPKDFNQPDGNLSNLFLNKLYIDNNEVIPGSNNILPKQLSQMQKITLNYLQNNFTLEFNNIDYLTDPSEKNVLYKLENYDKAWRKNNGENQANYYNVQPGKYVFRVKASNLYGNWTEKTLEIEIKPPWYKSMLAIIFYFIFLAFAGWNIHLFQKKRTIRKVQEQIKDKELEQAREIEKAYTELKATQAQLIQSEKMASLGELTAGIAHEIQNPLNFVNNFSDVNSELVEELKSERLKKKGERDETMEEELLNDIAQNTEKIKHHGKRASDIVKGMLQHSRTSNGQKEPTDINALADEYLRLSYHGLRAKDNSFNADFKTEFDESLPKINVIPQDIGRVLLNLINNAFYAVDKRAKSATPQPTPRPPEGGGESPQSQYKPVVLVSTLLFTPPSGGRGVKLVVKDNGEGIPQEIKDKIFQPFFTTKPTGQGTGLGLSLSYDIVKAHGGELKVETKEGEGSEFIIKIPIAI